RLIGPYEVKTTYYDADFNPVSSAAKPGRYGAIIEIQPETGRTIRRFRTLYRMPEDIPWLWKEKSFDVDLEFPKELGVSVAAAENDSRAVGDLLRWRLIEGFEDDYRAAALLAGLHEVGAGGAKTDFSNNAWAADRQWWVTFKQKFYGTDKVYPKPFIGLHMIEGEPAPVIRTGTLAEAGMKPDAARKIDAVCEEWAKNSDEAFAVCIVRHGVIVLHKPYGTRDGAPMTLTTKSWLASVSKLMTASVMMQFIDEGLVGLDDPVDKFLPAFYNIEVETPLTIRHLFTHTNGLWGHWGDELNDFEEVIAGYYPYLEIGKSLEYNGAGYALAGKIMETISGEALPQLFKNHLLAPLDCENTEITNASSSAMSVPMDMAKIGQMLLNGGSYGDIRFFRPETLEKALPERLTKVLGPDTTEEWGIGLTGMNWLDSTALSPRAFGHGALSNSILAMDPETDMVVVMTRNAEGRNFEEYKNKFFLAIAERIAK
ncbi:MAG: serine hydrolase, partial [Armatimonadetes bacterium]|nr:serine hydrolase [Armatimonadota bacterium]NIO95672.1 serine hydrolase [Armatimonadota bacterium]